MQRRSVETINTLNQRRYEKNGHPEIAARIKNYELAFRMQSAAPELIDLSGESKTTREAYGLDRSERDPKDKWRRWTRRAPRRARQADRIT